ncbi:hypothetical protein [Actinoallomurus sp. CA-142502]|uniref:hypothetical protein n=1 Tax=Actinoallomurus sp. CA-142502 TaxID=3239885 RepID=UPI003D8BA744
MRLRRSRAGIFPGGDRPQAADQRAGRHQGKHDPAGLGGGQYGAESLGDPLGSAELRDGGARGLTGDLLIPAEPGCLVPGLESWATSVRPSGGV